MERKALWRGRCAWRSTDQSAAAFTPRPSVIAHQVAVERPAVCLPARDQVLHRARQPDAKADGQRDEEEGAADGEVQRGHGLPVLAHRHQVEEPARTGRHTPCSETDLTDEKQLRFRYGVQVNSLGLSEAQPENNIVRIALEALGVTLSKKARLAASWPLAMLRIDSGSSP